MTFLIFLVVLVVAYFVWRVADQLPDVIFRLSEIQRDVAEVRRNVITDQSETPEAIPAKNDEKEEESSDGDS